MYTKTYKLFGWHQLLATVGNPCTQNGDKIRLTLIRINGELTRTKFHHMYMVFQKKMHKVCHVISFEPFVLGLGLRCLHQNAQQRLLLTYR